MELPPNPADSPSIPRHILKQIKKIDPGLHLQFSNYYVNKINGKPLIDSTGKPFVHPRWHVWMKNPNGKYYYITPLEDENGDYIPVDNRTVKNLEADAVRVLGAKEVLRRQQESRRRNKDRVIKKELETAREFASENKRKLQDVMDNPFGNRLKEKETITSYSGQSNRSRTTKIVDDSDDYCLPD